MASTLQCSASSFNYNYAPPDEVVFAHSFPHLTTSLSTGDATFDVASDPGSEFELATYVESLNGVPLLILAIGVFSLLVFQITIIARHECCSIHQLLRCGPSYLAGEKEDGWQMKIVRRKNIMYMLYNAFLVLIFLANHWVFVSYGTFADGISNMESGVSALNTLAADVLSITNFMDSQVSQVDAHLNSTAGVCHSNTTTGLIFDLHRYLQSLDDSVKQVSTALGELENLLLPDYGAYWIGTNNLHETMEASVFGFYFFILILLVVLALLPCCQQVTPVRVLAVMVQFIVLVLTGVCALEMIAIVSTTVVQYCTRRHAASTLLCSPVM